LRAQTSLELALVAVIILIAGLSSYVIYSEQSFGTAAEATIRTQTDLALSQAKFAFPNCTNAQLTSITRSGEGRALTYAIALSNKSCEPTLLPVETLKHISSMVSVALDCAPATLGECKGYSYRVNTTSTTW
jgi:hypothetical protein